MATPPAFSAVCPHPRGIFEEENTFPGVRVFKFYDCTGAQVIRTQVVSAWVSAELLERFESFLERCCPGNVPHTATYHADALRPTPVLKLEG